MSLRGILNDPSALKLMFIAILLNKHGHENLLTQFKRH